MKQITVENQTTDNSRPFWQPWGVGGIIWRYLLFLVALLLYLLLLFYLMTRRPGGGNEEVREDVYEYLDDRYDDMRGDEYHSPYLPRHDDNYLYDVPDDRIITDPEDPYHKIVDDKLNVILDGDANEETYNRFAEEFKNLYPGDEYLINYYNPLTNLLQLTVPPEERQQIKENLPNQINDVKFKVFYDELFNNCVGPESYNDPAFKNKKQSWHFAPIEAYDAWAITRGKPEVVVAVVDSYIDINHPELKGRVVKPYSVERRSSNVLPPPGKFSMDNPEDAVKYHGTHVAALAVGALDNKSGAAGLAPECSLMPISLGGQMTSMKLLDGILYAINQGADVVNVSIATLFPDEIKDVPLEEQLEYIKTELKEQESVWDYVFNLADERNCMIVWAAGNCDVLAGLDETKRNETTLRVSAVDSRLRKADFSNYGNYENLGFNYSDVSAPGSMIYSAVPGKNYAFCPGTSMAAPMVTGAVALMKSLNPNLTNAEVIKILKETGKPLNEKDHIGPLIQVRKALEAVGGDLANFDDIIKDPNSIVGLWETTEQRVVTDVTTGKPTGTMTHIFLKFTSPKGGTIIYKEDTGYTYTAAFTATFKKDKIIIEQPKPAKSKDTDTYFVPNTIICERGENGLLKCHNKGGGDEFFLVRVK